MIIAVDFDGTLIEDIQYPSTDYILKPGVEEVINNLVKNHTIVLCTARYGWYFWDAVQFIQKIKLPILIQQGKPVADIYIDDKNLNCSRIDWYEILDQIKTLEEEN